MAASAKGPPKEPLIVIIGTTGTGKSDLAVEIATRFNGEIINADAVQMYEGLPIITNKIPAIERKGIPHHLLGSIGLDEQPWTVNKFLPKTLQIIQEIRSRQKLPIVVGGTHYYTQATLFKDHTIEGETNEQPPDDYSKFPILKESNEAILDKLREVDPVMANRWHPNDRRKIQRSLQIYLETGKRASETYLERLQDNQEAMRFSTLILWPHCEREALKARLDKRVDRMLENGLLDEVSQLMALRKSKQEAGLDVDFTKGVWQAIGFRQFEPYQSALDLGSDEKDLLKLKREATEQTQAATRRYAASQLKWIRIKLLNALVRADAMESLFVLEGTELSKWNDTVVGPAVHLTQSFLTGTELPDATEISPLAKDLLEPPTNDLTHTPSNWGVQTCEVCGTKAATPQLWEKHIKSRGHKIRTSKKKARETRDLTSLPNQIDSKPQPESAAGD